MLFARRLLPALLGLAVCAPVAAADRVLLTARFDQEPVDQMLGTGGPAWQQPVRNDNAYVRLAPFASPHIEFVDSSTCCAQAAVFEFPGGEEIARGTLRVRADVYFPAPVSASIVSLREQGGAAVRFLDFYTGTLVSNGNGWLNVYAGSTYSGSLLSPGYPIGRWVPLEVQYSPDLRRVSIRLDNQAVWSATDFALSTVRGMGSLRMGSNDTGSGTGSVMRLDNLRVEHCAAAVFGDCLTVDGFDQ